MSIYEDETRSKIYPELNYRLAETSVVGAQFLGEIAKRKKIPKKMMRLVTILNHVGTGLITSVIIIDSFLYSLLYLRVGLTYMRGFI